MIELTTNTKESTGIRTSVETITLEGEGVRSPGAHKIIQDRRDGSWSTFPTGVIIDKGHIARDTNAGTARMGDIITVDGQRLRVVAPSKFSYDDPSLEPVENDN